MDGQYDDRAPPGVSKRFVGMDLLSVPGVHLGSQISEATAEARFSSARAILWATRRTSRYRVAIYVQGLRGRNRRDVSRLFNAYWI